MKLLYALLFIALFACTNDSTKEIDIKVLQFNIWQEGTVVNNGYGAIVDEIIRSEADLIALSEVRNYNNTIFAERIVSSMAKRGLTYYSHFSEDTGILSKYPIQEFSMLHPVKNDHGSISKAIIIVNSAEIAFYSGHLDYLNCALYLPRGYDGSTWEKLPDVVTDLKQIRTVDLASNRDEQIQAFIEDATQEISKGRIIIYGGDNNEPSHLDWTTETKDHFDHQGLVIPWHNSVLLDQKGFKDAYRICFPNPLSHPGFTFPANNKDIPLEKLVWSPDADDRDRIDYIFFYPDARLKLKNTVIIGPSGSIVNNKRIDENFEDVLVEPIGIWPTDHRAVLATFQLDLKHKKTP